MRMKRILGVAALAAVLMGAVAAQAATYYVDVNYDGANGAPDGTETRPWTTLAEAAAAHIVTPYGHTIMVAAGEYKSISEGGQENFGTTGYNLERRTGTWRGGYVGQVSGATFDWTAASRTLPDAYTTAPAVVTVVNLTNANSRAFTSTGGDHILVFEGFVFRDSDVSQANYPGGALQINGQNSASAIRHCVFINNKTTGEGGGLWLRGRSGTSRHVVFVGNTSSASGGGAYISGDNITHTIEHSTFKDNIAAASGGGLRAQHHVGVLDCHFEGNVANGSGDNAGGAINMTRTVTIERSTFISNSAPNGWGGAVGAKHWQNSYATLENCLVVSNSAANFTVVSYANHSLVSLTLRHVTMADNTGGGVITKAGDNSHNASFTVLNSIIANNGAKGLEYTDAGTLNVDYNNVIGHTTDYVGFTHGGNSISVDPQFVDANAGDYRLALGSPCVDAGTNLGVTADLNGVPRPTRGGYDIGAYEEWQVPVVKHHQPFLKSDEAKVRAEFSYTPDAYDSHAFIVLDTSDQGTNSMSGWMKQSGDLGIQDEGVIFAGPWFYGLSAESTYTYRIVASNAYDVAWGPVMTLTTPPVGTTRTWTGLGADNLASTAENWSGDTLPTWSDAIVLDSTTNKNMTWDYNGANGLPNGVAAWTQTADYTGTVTFNTTYATFSETFTLFAVVGDAVIENGVWTHQGHTSTQNSDATRRYRLRVTVGGDLTVGSAAKMNVFGRGLVNDNMSDQIRGTLGGQRSHESGTLPLPNRTTRGSITAPEDLGRGGDWGGSNARYGGGAIWLEIGGAATIDGEILARAGTWSNTGITPRSGSGGSIYLRTGTIAGGGLIDASNGDVGSVGSGGRVAVIVTNSTSFGSVVLRAFGGGSGPAAAGTVYKEHSGHGSGQGILVLDNNNQNHALYAQPYHAYGVTLMPDAANGGPVDLGQFAEIIVTNRAILGINTDTALDWSTVNLSTYGRDQSFIAIRATNGVAWPANFTVDGFTLLLDVDPRAAGNWTVAPGGRIARTFARHSSSQGNLIGYPLVPPLTLTLDGNLSVDAGGEITVQRMGYYSDSGPGRLSGNRASSHGGQGGSSDGTGGNPVYGSILFPATSGSGGQWGSQNFSPAGGRMRLAVTGTTILNGTLNAMPHTANQERSTGGSIWLTTGYLQGTTGVINARGRDGGLGGGGGRIAVYLTAGDDIGDVTLDARGGANATNPGAAGTVYVQTASDGPGGGRIEIWNEGRVQYNRAATPIPPATALVSDVPDTVPTYGAFTDVLSQTRWDLRARGRVLLRASQELDSITIANDAVLDLNGYTLLLKGAVIDGSSLKGGEHSAASLGLAQVIDSAGSDGRIIIPPPGSLFLMR